VPVRVLWVIKGLGPGGAERLLCAAARTHDLERFRIECAYVLPWKDHLAEELERAGVTTHCLSRHRNDRRWPLRLAAMVRDGDWDVVHVHSPLPGSVARLAARTVGRSRHPVLMSTEHNRWATHRWPTRLANRLTSRWDIVSFAVTEEVRQSMSGPIVAKAHTLRHGIDLESAARSAADRAAVRAEFSIDADEFVVGTVANFRPQKDYPNLFRAAAVLADRGVPARVLAVGQGPQEAETVRLRDELGLAEQVILTGFRHDAVRVMGACDAFTLASQWEGMPVALMEALALGLPVVATAVGGVAEELTDGVDALLVPPRDSEALATAIERVVTEPELRAKLSAAAAAKAVEYDVRVAVKRLEQEYVGAVPYRQVPQPAPVGTQARRRGSPGLDIREATPGDRPAIIELCRASLGWGHDPRFEQLFSWKHDQNAFGPSYMWVATDGGRVVGLRAFMRWEFVRGGQVLRAVRAVDTATHPDYQGKGLFTAMTEQGLDAVKADGVDFVFNTPNDKSKPGYLKMGWHEVGKVPVAIRMAGPKAAVTVVRSRVASSHWPLDMGIGIPIGVVLDQIDVQPASTDPRALVTNRSSAFAQWRYGADFLGYRVVGAPHAGLVVRVRPRGKAQELVVLDSLGIGRQEADGRAGKVVKQSRSTHALRVGQPNLRSGFVGYPGGGPTLTWRSVNAEAMPPLGNWELVMGDVELF
jgi:L-malate glycosyltransferase